MYHYVLKPQALKDLKKLPKDIQRRVINKIEFFIASGNPLSYAHSLINYELGEYRFRIGDYRVVFDVEEETLIILAIGYRRGINK